MTRRHPVAGCASLVALGLLTLVGACNEQGGSGVAPGTEVTIEMPDGSLVTGRLASADHTQVESPADTATTTPLGLQSAFASGTEPSTGAPGAPRGGAPPAEPAARTTDELLVADPPAPPSREWEAQRPTPEVVEEPALPVEVVLPAGTVLFVDLDTTLASDVSRREDPVRAIVTEDVVVDGLVAVPAGSVLHGSVTAAEASGRVSGRARLSFRFHEVDVDAVRYEMRSEALSYQAQGTKTDDAKTIGIGAGAGALIGGLIGGGRGAGTGAAIGGGAGTAVVLTTSGDEVALRSGAPLEVELARPLTIDVPRG